MLIIVYFCTNLYVFFVYSQILMSVLRTILVVPTFVLTLMDPTPVLVTVGIHFLMINTIAQVIVYLIQNSQAVKKVCGPQKGYGEKRCEIQGGGQEMAVMVG